MMRLAHRIAVVASLACCTAALAAAPALAKDVYLVAKPFSKTMPDGALVPMWGFAADPDADESGVGDCYEDLAGACDAAAASSPGPALALAESDAGLTVWLTNLLNAPVSLVIAGAPLPSGSQPVWSDGASGARTDPAQRVRSFTHEAAPAGGRQSWSWPALAPGTRLYQSGTHPQVQVQMGLYGEVRKPHAAGEAYPGVAFDRELTLLFGEIDPALHQAVADGSYGTPPGPTSTLDYRPRYFLINGEPWSPASECIDPQPAIDAKDRVLIRMLNGGLRELVPIVLQTRWLLVAEAGQPYRFARDQYSAHLAPGSTSDALWRPGRGADYRLLERRLSLTNAAASGGGMQTCIRVRSSATCGLGAELALVLPLLLATRRWRAARPA
jgi:hypothetical protein